MGRRGGSQGTPPWSAAFMAQVMTAEGSEGTAAVDPVRVLIVEDHRLLADALALGLGDRGLECRVAELVSAAAVAAQALDWRPGLVLLDLDLGEIDGLDLVQGLRVAGAQVLVVTAVQDHARLAAAVALGACGWVAKNGPFEDLLQAAELAARDRPLVPPEHRRALAELGRRRLDEDRSLKERTGQLTSRELEVLEALAAGRTAAEIAAGFVVSLGTVRTHIRSILLKLGVSSQLAAVALTRPLLLSRGGAPPVATTLPGAEGTDRESGADAAEAAR